jgi:hypothetical protein
MPLDPDDATPHDEKVDPAAEQEAALQDRVRDVQNDPLLGSATEVLLGHIQNMILTAARVAGGAATVRRIQAQLANLAPDTAREFTEQVRKGYGRGSDAKIGVLYCRFLADRIAETSATYRRDDPRRLHTLLKMASETLLLQDVQEQRASG